MPFGVGIGEVVGLVSETRGLEDAAPQIAVSGEGASELALALTAAGDPGVVTVGFDPAQATVAIRMIRGEPSTDEIAALRRLSRTETALIVVHRGEGRIPYALPGDVLEAGAELPLHELVRAIVRLAGDTGPALAARLPVLRPEVARRLIATTALSNAVIATSTKMQQAQLPVLTLAQSRMMLMLGVGRGERLPRDPQQLALAAGPAVASCVGVGLGARALVRRLPVKGRLVRATVAYVVTRMLGEARLRF